MSEAIIFDLDGTLYEADGLNEENKYAAALAISDFKKVDLETAKLILTKRQHSPDGDVSLSRALFLLGVPDDVFMRNQLACLNPENYIDKDYRLVTLIRSARLLFKVALYTNTRRQIVGRILTCVGFSESDFDLIVAGGDVTEPKPSVLELKKIVAQLGVTPEHCYVVGDRWVVDLAPAEKLGMKPVLVKTRNVLINWLETLI